MIAKREGGCVGRIGSLGLAMFYIGWINSKVLLYNTVNSIQYSETNHNEKECVCVYANTHTSMGSQRVRHD